MSIFSGEMEKKVLMTAVASVILESGFENAEQSALETLTEMAQSFLVEAGNSTRAYYELACRTEALFADVLLALIGMGVQLTDLEQYAKRQHRTSIPAPVPSVQPKQLSILQAGVKHSHPPQIASHLPSFPDPHAYIRTPTHKQPVTEYEAIREKSACQKRDIERALNKFATKTHETDSLFLSPDNMFPLIACKPKFPPFLTALLPIDQVFEADEEDTTHSPLRKRGKEIQKEEEETSKNENDTIDNPYLRPVKLPPTKLKILLPPPPSANSPSP